MANKTHIYRLTLDWTGNQGTRTSGYRAYSRAHSLSAPGKPPILGSSDPAFLGDPARWNPEELLVASLSACHQLWYLHLASEAGLTVTAYRDEPEGRMVEDDRGAGRFECVTLRPQVTLSADHDAPAVAQADALHDRAHALCFVARSMAFPVQCEPTTRLIGDSP